LKALVVSIDDASSDHLYFSVGIVRCHKFGVASLEEMYIIETVGIFNTHHASVVTVADWRILAFLETVVRCDAFNANMLQTMPAVGAVTIGITSDNTFSSRVAIWG